MDKNRNILIVAHKQDTTHPQDELFTFLNKNDFDNVLYIQHRFHDAPDRESRYLWYKKGKLYKKYSTRDYKKLPEPILYFKEVYFTFLWVIRSKTKWNVYIGMDGLLVMFGNILRSMGVVQKTIFWAIDFVPFDRFSSGWKEKIYHLINTRSYKDADEMWDLSPRMKEARYKFLGVKPTDYRKHRVVSNGNWTNRIKKYGYDECQKDTLVFMGHLIPKQGVQLVINCIPDILEKRPDFKFKIIGDGAYKRNLEMLSHKKGVSSSCIFTGLIPDIKDVEKEIAKSCLAIAPYVKKLDTWTYYADPGKVKTYLACGVPVLLTGIPWNAKEIQSNKCGAIITEDLNSITSNIIKYMRGDINPIYRENAIKYSQTFNNKNIFESLKL